MAERIADAAEIAVPPYTLRPPRDEDAQAICDLVAACDTALNGHADRYSPEDVREGWARLDRERDAWVFVAPDGSLAAYGELNDQGHGKLIADGYVHPAHWGRGLGTALARLYDARGHELVARQPEGVRVIVGTGTLAADTAAADLFRAHGYTRVRGFWVMRIDLDAPPPAPEWPEGIGVRTFVPGRDERETFTASDTAFGDHWGHVPGAFDEWLLRTQRPDFDPSLWFLAVDETDGGRIVGIALCSRRVDLGWVNSLGVLRASRQRGLGVALLRHSFAELYARGERAVGLGVDSQNLTGATRLYQKAGMRVDFETSAFEKVLRDGTDAAVRSL